MKEIEPVDEEFDGEYEEDPEAGLMETEVIRIRDDGENELEATTALKISDIPEEAEEKPKVSSPRPATKKKKQAFPPGRRNEPQTGLGSLEASLWKVAAGLSTPL